MQLKIFFLDDEFDICDLFKELFSSEDRLIKTFTNYKSLLREYAIERPDMLIVDYRMPDISGTDVAKLIDSQVAKVLITGEIDMKPGENFIKVIKKPFCIGDINNFLDDFKCSIDSSKKSTEHSKSAS